MDIEDCRIGMEVRSKWGQIGRIETIYSSGGVHVTLDGRTRHLWASDVEPVREFQVGDRVRQIAPSELGFTDNMGQIGTIDKEYKDGSFDVSWDNGHGNTLPPASIERVHPALHVDDFRPLIEVAKCHVQVEPEKLLLSQDAKRVIEYLTAADTPIAFYRIAEGLKDMVSGAAIIDGLIEAREAGIVRLDEGKYSIVRD